MILMRKFMLTALILFSLVLTLPSCGTMSEDVSDTSIAADVSTASQFDENETPPTTISETAQTETSQPAQTVTSAATQVTTIESSQPATNTTTQTTTSESIQTVTSTTTQATTSTSAKTETSATSNTDTEYPPLEPLTSEADLKLREDFAKYKSAVWDEAKAEDMFVVFYYGTYNNYEAVVMASCERPVTDDIKKVTIAGQTFELPSGSYEILLHKDSSFIGIEKAYENGYINKVDIAAMKHYDSTGQANRLSADKTDGKSIEPQELPMDAYYTICEDYAKYISDGTADVPSDNVWVTKYYGTYNGCEVVTVFYSGSPTSSEEQDINVAGYTIPVRINILLHKNSSFIDIRSAYDKGYLTDDDISDIFWYSTF
jgi:hypothetical protein